MNQRRNSITVIETTNSRYGANMHNNSSREWLDNSILDLQSVGGNKDEMMPNHHAKNTAALVLQDSPSYVNPKVQKKMQKSRSQFFQQPRSDSMKSLKQHETKVELSNINKNKKKQMVDNRNLSIDNATRLRDRAASPSQDDDYSEYEAGPDITPDGKRRVDRQHGGGPLNTNNKSLSRSKR